MRFIAFLLLFAVRTKTAISVSSPLKKEVGCNVDLKKKAPPEAFDYVCDTMLGGWYHYDGSTWAKAGAGSGGCHTYKFMKGPKPSCSVNSACLACEAPSGTVVGEFFLVKKGCEEPSSCQAFSGAQAASRRRRRRRSGRRRRRRSSTRRRRRGMRRRQRSTTLAPTTRAPTPAPETTTTTTTTMASTPPPGPKVSAKEWEHYLLVNKARKNGFSCPGGKTYSPNASPLAFDCRLWKASQLHSQDMADQNYFSHISKDGRTPFDRARAQGISGNGENIAAGRPSAADVLNQWLKSDGHCRNIGNPGFKMFGVGYGHNAKARYRHYWTQMFSSDGVSPDHSCLPASDVASVASNDAHPSAHVAVNVPWQDMM
mmetsp:Transcript_125783/g.221469  ORF Transcript_125783/g.221469 Transcript_125783/m.221469 type:complete len:370 (-) Transcript_125783:39-1148(-)